MVDQLREGLTSSLSEHKSMACYTLTVSEIYLVLALINRFEELSCKTDRQRV